MEETSRVPVPVRFGPFEVLPETGELRRNGRRFKLSGQVFQVLMLLLESPGQVVTREVLQQKLWPGASYGDFDHGLNAAVNRLREVLGDSATEPKFIETIPRRGYRFISPIERATQTSVEAHVEKVVPKLSQNRALSLMVVILGIAFCVSAVMFFSLRKKQALQPINIVQFTSLPGFEVGPSFSPDGTQVVFSASPDASGWDLYIKAIGDEKTLRLTNSPGMSCCPHWSPDGKTIAYTHRAGMVSGDLETSILLMTPLGGAKRQIRRVSESSSCNMSWSPDSAVLAYDDKPPGESSGIFLMTLADSSARRITTAPAGMFDGSPAFSPDGRLVAFVRNTDDGGNPSINLISLQGGSTNRLTSMRGIGRLVWTRDGKKIIFSAMGFFPGESALFSVPAVGGEPERLQFISSDASGPAISPAGNKLAYTTGFLDANIWRIPIKDAHGAPVKLIASTRLDNQPNLSPDGSKLAFASNRDGSIAVWISNADGTDPVRISRLRGATPEWSPDGKYIVFDSNEGGHWFIVIAAVDGSGDTLLADTGADRRGPSWSADGKWVYFTSNRSGPWEIWKASFPGNKPVQITHHGGGYAQESPDGNFVYYQKPKTNNRYDFALLPEIWRMPSAGGHEQLVVNVNAPAKPADLAWFWRVTHDGIYFVDNSAQPRPLLKLYSLTTRNVRTLRQLDKQAWGGPGLTLSPDGRFVMIGQVDDAGSDIMFVENFPNR